ncbi:unnamed protein product [Ascophyllum nodosum]
MLPAGTPEQRAEVDSWVDFATTFSAEHVAGVDRHLSGRSFLAGGAFSLADVAAYFACAGVVAAADASFSKKNFSRWFNHVQHRVKNMAPSCKALPAVVTLDLFTPVPVPLPPKPAAALDTEGKSKEGSPGTPEADRTPTGANGGAEPSTNNHKKDKKKDKKKKKEGRENANGEAPPPAAAAGGADGVDGAKAGVGGSSAAEAQASTAEPAAAQGDPSKLDVRVGVIVKAWEHPDSDKLFCEEIDLGEGKHRNIASGLRAFYSLEEMQGRRVIVLANLKTRNIGGFKSEGMVLCASSADHSVVKIIEPPPTAAVGARATVSGTEGEPATPAQMTKKKILEKCVPKLRTNSEGVAGYEGVGVFNVDGDPCVATIPEAHVS